MIFHRDQTIDQTDDLQTGRACAHTHREIILCFPLQVTDFPVPFDRTVCMFHSLIDSWQVYGILKVLKCHLHQTQAYFNTSMLQMVFQS